MNYYGNSYNVLPAQITVWHMAEDKCHNVWGTVMFTQQVTNEISRLLSSYRLYVVKITMWRMACERYVFIGITYISSSIEPICNVWSWVSGSDVWEFTAVCQVKQTLTDAAGTQLTMITVIWRTYGFFRYIKTRWRKTVALFDKWRLWYARIQASRVATVIDRSTTFSLVTVCARTENIWRTGDVVVGIFSQVTTLWIPCHHDMQL